MECYLLRAHRVLFSLNVAFAIVLAIEFGYDGVFVPILRLEEMIYNGWGLKGAGGAVSGYLAFAICVVGLTLPLLLLTSWLQRTLPMRHVLVYVAGFAAFGVVPACWFYVKRRYGWNWYPAEVLIYFAAVPMYIVHERIVPAFIAVGLACAHFAFWYFRFSAYEHSPLELVAPVIAFCSSVVWIIYVPLAEARPSSPG
jgi:hypothetical protein